MNADAQPKAALTQVYCRPSLSIMTTGPFALPITPPHARNRMSQRRAGNHQVLFAIGNPAVVFALRPLVRVSKRCPMAVKAGAGGGGEAVETANLSRTFHGSIVVKRIEVSWLT